MTNIAVAKRVISQEIAGLEALKDSIDGDFNTMVERIYDNVHTKSGRVILSGMGKSGHIARKIAATIASTGTPAFFVHPGEASHGDMGMITKSDVVILLSNSGETHELRDIISYTRRFAIPLVALVRRAESMLVEAADIAIVLPEVPEASPIGVPTTSTTMMLACGDALAVAPTDAVFLDDIGMNCKAGRAFGFTTIKVDDPDKALDELAALVELPLRAD